MASATSYADVLDDALAAYDEQRAPIPAAAPAPAQTAPGAMAMRAGVQRDPLGELAAAPAAAPAQAAPEQTAPGAFAMRAGVERKPLGEYDAAPAARAAMAAPAARAPAFDDAPQAYGARRGLDPELAAILARRNGRAMAPTAATPSDPNRAAKIVDAIASGLSQSRTGRAYDTRFWGGVDQQRRADAEKARAIEAADPNSAISKQQRAAMGPLLGKIGLQPDEIGALSAADIRAMTNGGKIAQVLAEARERQAIATAARAQKVADTEEERAYREKLEGEGRAYEEKKRADQRAYDEAQSAGPKFERQKAIARIQSNLGATRAAQQALLTDDLAAKRAADAAERTQTQQDKRDLAENTKQYGRDLQKTGILQARDRIGRVRGLIAKLEKKNGQNLFRPQDDAIRRGADFFNQPQAYGALSDPEAKDLMREVQKMRNTEIRDTSGGAVSGSEMGRNTAALGSTAFNSVGDMVKWVDSVEQGLDTDESTYLGAYGPDVRSNYLRNQGAQSAPAPAPAPTNAGAKGKRLRLADGGSAADTPANREKLKGKFQVIDG